jgi:hypothetical protein
MTLKLMLVAGASAIAMLAAGSAMADDDTYICNDRICYDYQADDTRRLNRQAFDQAQADSAADRDAEEMYQRQYRDWEYDMERYQYDGGVDDAGDADDIDDEMDD